uniref:Uncharacterized protein n=1 Tax=Mus musculus TaxID=10090 RepID=Q3UKT2_MOUSE|nr:unnamed protein product [Mus musculus]
MASTQRVRVVRTRLLPTLPVEDSVWTLRMVEARRLSPTCTKLKLGTALLPHAFSQVSARWPTRGAANLTLSTSQLSGLPVAGPAKPADAAIAQAQPASRRKSVVGPYQRGGACRRRAHAGAVKGKARPR